MVRVVNYLQNALKMLFFLCRTIKILAWFYLALTVIICNMTNVDNEFSLLASIICLPLRHWNIQKTHKDQ